MPRTILIYVLIIAILVTGCSVSTPEPLQTNLPVPEGEWTVKMTHSGGIMGLLRSIEISSDGHYSVVDERTSQTITSVLAADDLSKLKEQIASSEYFPVGRPDGMGCADCFVYDLEIQGSGGKFKIQLNDVNLQNSGLAVLVNYLRSLIDSAL